MEKIINEEDGSVLYIEKCTECDYENKVTSINSLKGKF